MDAGRAQKYARIAGVLFVVSLVAGGFGESHVPQTLLIANDLAGTAHKVAASAGLFRASFAAYLVEATCDLTLTVLLYALLRPVSRTLSLLAAIFGLFSTAVFAAGEIFYFAAALPVVDADVARVIPPDAQAALTYLCLTIYGYVFGIFAAFYGIAVILRGFLIFRSGYLPRALGALLIFGGLSFVTLNFFVVLAPQYHLPYAIAPMVLAMIAMALWMLVKGVDRTRWDKMQTREAATGN
jgi:hypothetical protein